MKLRVAVLLLGNATIAAAQNAVVSGRVVDSTTRQPVAGAIVALRSGDRILTERTDEAGAFSIVRVPVGDVSAQVKRIGYRIKDMSFFVRTDTTLSIVVAPSVRTLAPVNVLGKGEGVFGVIGRSADLKPIPGARVMVIGSGVTDTTDDSGEFFIPLKQPGAYLVRVVADGYGEEVLPLTVKKNEIAESSQLLDASDRQPLSAGLWKDFDQRLRWRPVSSALVSGAELRAHGSSVANSLEASPSVLARQLKIIPDDVCLFVNGQPRPGATVDDFRVEDIRAIELYLAKDSSYLSSLWLQWPRKRPCGTGMGNMSVSRRAPPGSAKVRWAVIWLR